MKFLLFGIFGLLLSSSSVVARPISSVTEKSASANKLQITTISRHLPFRFYRPDSEEAEKDTATAEQEDSDSDGSRVEERSTIRKLSEKHLPFRNYPSESESPEDLESRDSNAVPFSQYPPEEADI
ncbi:hypothetical protein R3P38DRAFT_3201152 [Favolaschia claudopus]|uniref:Uncharacterized protein n=1 Tax=Favolaschia claudopus TaxID=2862362 RepID=A0AAW0AWH6_9AGAR